MTMQKVAFIDLPEHRGAGGFDHADIHLPSDRLYVAHTSNDAIDVIDCARDQYIKSMPGLTAVAGALVSEARGLVFTSNRGENTVSVFAPLAERDAFKIAVGVKPNGLAFDPVRGILIAANVGEPGVIDVIDLGTLRCAEVVPTEAGAHTLALDRKRNKVYAFLPRTHRAMVFVDTAAQV